MQRGQRDRVNEKRTKLAGNALKLHLNLFLQYLTLHWFVIYLLIDFIN